jgi:hypothetical protein
MLPLPQALENRDFATCPTTCYATFLLIKMRFISSIPVSVNQHSLYECVFRNSGILWVDKSPKFESYRPTYLQTFAWHVFLRRKILRVGAPMGETELWLEIGLFRGRNRAHTEVIHKHGRAVAQAVRRWLPTAAARVLVRGSMWGLWWTKRHWDRFPPSTSVSLANHSTNFSIIKITRGWHKRPLMAAVPSGYN